MVVRVGYKYVLKRCCRSRDLSPSSHPAMSGESLLHCTETELWIAGG